MPPYVRRMTFPKTQVTIFRAPFPSPFPTAEMRRQLPHMDCYGSRLRAGNRESRACSTLTHVGSPMTIGLEGTHRKDRDHGRGRVAVERGRCQRRLLGFV